MSVVLEDMLKLLNHPHGALEQEMASEKRGNKAGTSVTWAGIGAAEKETDREEALMSSPLRRHAQRTETSTEEGEVTARDRRGCVPTVCRFMSMTPTVYAFNSGGCRRAGGRSV